MADHKERMPVSGNTSHLTLSSGQDGVTAKGSPPPALYLIGHLYSSGLQPGGPRAPPHSQCLLLEGSWGSRISSLLYHSADGGQQLE
jgi:hypothetical protein